jgi:hypothetical protein
MRRSEEARITGQSRASPLAAALKIRAAAFPYIITICPASGAKLARGKRRARSNRKTRVRGTMAGKVAGGGGGRERRIEKSLARRPGVPASRAHAHNDR